MKKDTCFHSSCWRFSDVKIFLHVKYETGHVKCREQDVLTGIAESYEKYILMRQKHEFGVKQIDYEAWGNDTKECAVEICWNTGDVYDASQAWLCRFVGSDTRVLVFGISIKWVWMASNNQWIRSEWLVWKYEAKAWINNSEMQWRIQIIYSARKLLVLADFSNVSMRKLSCCRFY